MTTTTVAFSLLVFLLVGAGMIALIHAFTEGES